MKFSNGCWMQKEGTSLFTPQQAYFVKNEGDALVICAPTGRVHNKGCTLGGVNLTVRITSPANEILRVQVAHYLGTKKKTPEFDLELTENKQLDIEENDEEVIVKSGSLSIVVAKENWSMAYYRNGELLTSSSLKDLAYLKTDFSGMAYDSGTKGSYMRQQLNLGVGERVYGMGERFTHFVKNGQAVDIWNEDGGTSTQQSYKNIPFYITNKGYGVLVNHPEKVSFEVASEFVRKVGFSVPGESLDYYLINGPSMKEVLMRYTDLTGKPALPAPWTFGLWLSTSFTTDYDEETVMNFIDGMLERDIPLDVFHFDCFWMKEFHWSDFMWDSRVFPDPNGMLKRIKEKNIKVCVWINPYIGQESALFNEGVENNYFVMRPDGDVWQWDMWQSGMALVDFTNPDAAKWYQDKLEALLDMGVDCFKTDFGERIPLDVVYHDGSDPHKMHNYYSYMYNKIVFELLEQKRGKGDAVLFARSATVGGQKFPVHWGGDCWSDYEAMAESLRGGLSLTMSGFGYWSHDIGGFEHTSTPDIYKRWAAFGLLSSHSRLHGSTSYRVPWHYDEEAVDVLRFFTKLKASLMPYLFRNAIYTSKSGVPMMRSMVLEFTDDENCAYIDKQYMMGDSLLVAPVFNNESVAHFYLPQGSWTNFITGEVKQGGRWYKENCGYLNIPLYVKENSIVAVGSCNNKADYDYAKNVELRVYELAGTAQTEVYSGKAEQELSVIVKKDENEIIVEAKGNKPYTMRFVNCGIAAVEGAKAQADGKDTIVTPNKNAEKIILNVK